MTDVNPYASGLYDESVTPVILPSARALSAYEQSLDALIDKETIEVLIPTSDYDVAAVLELLDRGWDPPVRLFRPSLATQKTLSNKAAFARHLRRGGFPVPRTWESPEEAKLPVVVKPAQEGGGKGVYIAFTQSELADAVSQVSGRYSDGFVIQEYIPGGVGSTYMSLLLYDQTGNLIFDVVMRSSLTFFTWGAGGNAGSIVNRPDIGLMSKRIIELAGGWSGPICVEYRCEPVSQKIFPMEANCRLNGYSYLVTMNGVNLPRLMVDILLDRPTAGHPRTITEGRTNFVLGFRERIVKDRFV